MKHLERAELQIARGKPLALVRESLKLHFEEVDYQNWLADKKAEFDSLFKTIENEDGTYDYVEEAPTFYDWLNETKSVLVGTVDEEDANGVVYEKEIFEDQPIHIYTPNDVTSLVDEYLANNKYLALQSLEITSLDNGLRFYTDDKSLIDLMIADREAERLGAANEDMTDWKTPDGIMQVSIGNIREAISTRLSNKAKIVGVI